jgi:hypothetical protein
MPRWLLPASQIHHVESKVHVGCYMFTVNRRLWRRFESAMIVSKLVNLVGLILDMPNQCKLVNSDVDLDANFSTSEMMDGDSIDCEEAPCDGDVVMLGFVTSNVGTPSASSSAAVGVSSKVVCGLPLQNCALPPSLPIHAPISIRACLPFI